MVNREPTSTGATDVQIRWMIRRDMPRVLEIENQAFESPWLDNDFTQQMRRRECVPMVAESDGLVVGHVVYLTHRNSLELINIAVADCVRRSGVGRAMINRLQGKLHPNKRTRLIADVREVNLAAQLLFRSCGFRATAVVHDRFDGPEDAYRFVYSLGSAR